MNSTWLQQPEQGAPCAIIAEVGQSHDGSLGLAHAFIDAIADAGADAVKFQTHIAAAESTKAEPWRKSFSQQDATRYEYWRRMEFTLEQWQGLREHAKRRQIGFMSSPFSLEAVELLEKVGVEAWKVPSGEITNLPLLGAMAATNMPVILSTGMSGLEEIDEAVSFVRGQARSLAILQCTSLYPCPPERIGLNVLSMFRERYQSSVGLSDHSGTIYPGLAAATMGMEVLEVHVTLSREMFGPDVPASVTTDELRQLVNGIRMIETMKAYPVEKTITMDEVAPLRDIFMKSIVAREDLREGTILRHEHLTTKKPATGLTPGQLPKLLGRRLRRSVARDSNIVFDDVE
ncbi:MAG: N-acetylneuraminate synthase family protein [Nitrospirales bacterium]|nr:N-acetylneuraminate synthase family protein [Nitrospira sp.]MDR4503144.1 N-acetylneuraminate synthase family protein [Nitrospirales bacterium]